MYGHDGHDPITDVDDCLGRDSELRSDGEFKSTAAHCALIAPVRAAVDECSEFHLGPGASPDTLVGRTEQFALHLFNGFDGLVWTEVNGGELGVLESGVDGYAYKVAELFGASDRAKDRLLVLEQKWSVFAIHDDNEHPAAEVLGGINEFWERCRGIQNAILEFQSEALRDEDRLWKLEQLPRIDAMSATRSIPVGQSYDEMRNRTRAFISSLDATKVPDGQPRSLAKAIEREWTRGNSHDAATPD